MENNETWRERLKSLWMREIERGNSPYLINIEAFISAELLSLADKIGAAKMPEIEDNRMARNCPPDDMHRHFQRFGHNQALDTSISLIKEMVK